MLKTDDNPVGTPIKAFDDLRAAVVKDRSQLWAIPACRSTAITVPER